MSPSTILPEPLAIFEYPWKIRFVDTDASGFAHFSSYLKMMEETEYAFLRSRGLSVVLHDDRGTKGFPRLSTELEIRRPLVFEEEVSVRLNLREIDGKQLTYEFDILVVDEQVAKGKFIVALCRFPADKPPYAILISDEIETALKMGANDVPNHGHADIP